MMLSQEREQLSARIRVSRKALLALGDETRQHIITALVHAIDNDMGMRVNDISALTHLSRAAVSHHLKVLRDAGIMDVRHEGKKNFYFFSEDTGALGDLIGTLEHARMLLGGYTGGQNT